MKLYLIIPIRAVWNTLSKRRENQFCRLLGGNIRGLSEADTLIGTSNDEGSHLNKENRIRPPLEGKVGMIQGKQDLLCLESAHQ